MIIAMTNRFVKICWLLTLNESIMKCETYLLFGRVVYLYSMA